MPTMWEELGFSESPYNASPLLARQEDLELLVGRENDSINFFTALDSAREGVFVLSGVPGVGKTSFLNIQQYRSESGQTEYGPHLLAARKLCPIQPDDSPRDVAQRIVHSLVRSVEEYCGISSREVPKQVRKIGKWVNTCATNGFEIGIQILGCGGNVGRTTQLPSAANVTFEGFRDAIECIVSEVVNELGFAGAFVVLDNLENLDDTQLNNLLISFRDTLFSLSCVWWILIGQSGLGSLIRSLDPRVAERLTGAPLELNPISLNELNQAIALRVTRFHTAQNGKSPLPSEVHKHLHDASHGEIRFVFQYSNSICIKIMTDIRTSCSKSISTTIAAKENQAEYKKAIDKTLGKLLASQEVISTTVAEEALRVIVENELKGLSLSPKDKWILKQIGKHGGARPRDFKRHKCKSSQEFYSRFISVFQKQHLLFREQEGKAVTYRLRGIARLAAEFKLLDTLLDTEA